MCGPYPSGGPLKGGHMYYLCVLDKDLVAMHATSYSPLLNRSYDAVPDPSNA